MLIDGCSREHRQRNCFKFPVNRVDLHMELVFCDLYAYGGDGAELEWHTYSSYVTRDWTCPTLGGHTLGSSRQSELKHLQ